jgi:NAD+ kinase
MESSFQRIGLIGRGSNDQFKESLQRLVALLDARGLTPPLIESSLAKLLVDYPYAGVDRSAIGAESDLVIVLGGDGSMLSAAREMAEHDVPVLGVNRGRLGFLTDISPDAIEEQVSAVLEGKFTLEQRFLLDVQVRRDDAVISRSAALNDVVVSSGTSAQMIEFDLYVNDAFVYRQRADGLIVSTPTGSTAYSLSGGGPIMHPSLDAVLLLPMYPHTLSSRPIVVDGNSDIEIVIGIGNSENLPVTCDGQDRLSVSPNDRVCIAKKSHHLTLVHPTGHDFYASCRDKLHWGGSLVT